MKNSRVIISIIAFVAAFIFSAGLVRIIFPAPVVKYVYTQGPRVYERNTNEIESFLLRDIRNGESRVDYKYDDNYSEAVMDYWKASSSMDASRFPQDFQDAWREHMQAWRNYGEHLKAKKEAKNSTRCNPEKRYIGEINRTWEEVKSIGRTYGAYVE
jgi:hypothetical protein